MNGKTSFRDSALRAISIIGLVAILVLGAWGIIQLAVGVPDFVSRFSSSSQSTTTAQTSERLAVTAPNTITSDQPFTLSWSHTNSSEPHTYTISYACADGLMFAAPMPTGQMRLVPCNTPFNFTNATQKVELIPVLHTAGSVQTTLTVTSRRLANDTVTTANTSAVITVTPAVAPTATKPATTKAPAATTKATKVTKGATKAATTYTPSGRTTNLYGTPDLTVRMISLTPTNNGRYEAQFAIANNGTNVAARGWDFYAEIPLNPPYQYVSQTQQALYPGDSIVYTLGFDAPAVSSGYGSYNTQVFSVTVDPQNLITEANKSNNTDSATIRF